MPNMSVCLSSNIIVLLILINSWSSFFHLVRTNLQISLSFMILGILVTFAGVVFVFPLWHRGFFLVGFVCGVLGGKLNWVNNLCYTSCYFPLISCSSFLSFSSSSYFPRSFLFSCLLFYNIGSVFRNRHGLCWFLFCKWTIVFRLSWYKFWISHWLLCY